MRKQTPQKFFKNNPFKTGFDVHRKLKGRDANQKGGIEMTDMRATNTDAIRDQELDEELADVLIAISVITKRLAKKINVNQTEKGEKE